MLVRIKFAPVLIVCLAFFSIGVLAQSNPTDEEIQNLEKRLVELKKQKIEAYKKEIEKLEKELGTVRQENNENANVPQSNVPMVETLQPLNTSAASTQPTPTTTVDSTTTAQNNPTTTTDGKCARVLDLDNENASTFDDNLCRLARKVVDEGSGQIKLRGMKENVANLLAAKFASVNTTQNTVSNSEKRTFFYNFDNKRTDKQVGAGSNSSGTTSLVVKGGTSAILGWAVENGSVTSAINGNTVTVRVNPYNFSNAVFRKMNLYEIMNTSENKYSGSQFFDLRKLSFGFSFDTTRGTDVPTFIISKQQLASWSMRYEIINNRNPLSPRYADKRKLFWDAQKDNLDTTAVELLKLVPIDKFTSPLLEMWKDEINAELKKLPAGIDRQTRIELVREVIEKKLEFLLISELMTENVEVEILDANDKTVKIKTGDLFVSSITKFTDSTMAFKKGRDIFLKEVNKGQILTFEYTNIREVNAPDLSNLRLIWEKGLLGRIDFTLNAEMTMFNKKPLAIDIKRIRDFNLAFQFDAPLNDVLPFGNSILSFSTRYTRQQSDVVLPNGVVADGTRGDILFGQGKLTIPIGETGIKLPLSFTFGNRSEFVKERFTRANFGVAFDLDQIFKPLSIFR